MVLSVTVIASSICVGAAVRMRALLNTLMSAGTGVRETGNRSQGDT